MKRFAALAVFFLAVSFAQQVRSHCEIPCGIYDDPLRIALMREHITTIEKSMNMIKTLTGESETNYNQIVRWVDNKEHHAEEMQHIVWQYFMTQRIKPVDAADEAGHAVYSEQIALLHELLIAAMKSKQTVDLEHIGAMRALVDRFEASYLGKR